jgi:hypothetical protein
VSRVHWLLWISLALLILAGCAFQGGQLVDADQGSRLDDLTLPLEPGHAVGQTFVARHGGLAGIEFFLLPGDGSLPTLSLYLRQEPGAAEDVAGTSLALPDDAEPGMYRFAFPPRAGSHGEYYYAFLEASTPGISVALAGGEAYLDGAAYWSHQPLDAQTSFRLVYAPAYVALDLIKAGLAGTGLLGIAGLLFVVPGWAMLAWLLPGERRVAWPEVLGLAVGLSLAVYPVLILWTHLVGLNLGPGYAWLPVVAGVVALGWRFRGWRPRHGWVALGQWARSDALWPDLALLIVLGLVFGVRLLVIRSLETPLWGDSHQHTVIAQLLLDNGGLFASWEPYAAYESLTVHFGFPAAAASLTWLTGMNSVQATLLTGQLVNGMSALALYPLALRLARGNRWAGVGAVLVAGLLSPMPAYYVNWGRYAQLGGQLILPVAIWLLWETVETDGHLWKAVVLAGCTIAGMTLTYYRMPLYLAPFVLAWLIGWALPRWRGSIKRWWKGLARLTLLAGVVFLLLLPWGFRVAGGTLATAVSTGIAAGSRLDRVVADYRVWRDLDFYVPLPLAVGAGLAIVWSLVQRRWIMAAQSLWILGLASLVAGSLIHLPGANLMQNFAVLIALYIPVSLLLGWLIGQVARLANLRLGNLGQWAIGLTLLGMAVWAAIGQLRMVQPEHVMVTRPDTQAMAWIRNNTSPEARFLVEGFRIYGGYSAVGADAGWWIPLLAGRQSTMPPQYALLNEVPAEEGTSQRLVELISHLEGVSLASPEGVARVCEWGITHVYIGQRQGKVGIGVTQLFSPEALASAPAFSLAYRQDRVHIFALDSRACVADNQ